MRTTKENIAGWIGSILFHTVLFLVLLLINVPEIIPQAEFVEMSWGSMTRVAQAASVSSTSQGSSAEFSLSKSARISRPTQIVAPPERRLPDLSDDILQVPRTEKLASAEADQGNQKSSDIRTAGERESGMSRRLGEKETRLSDGGIGNAPGPTPASAGLGSAAGSIDQGVSFSVLWLGGETRKKISGELPRYPEGVNVEAQIRILAVVLPDGSVKVLQPAQKGNTRLEEAAMREVRFWRFEPLKPSQPQVEQKCEVVFLFTLK